MFALYSRLNTPVRYSIIFHHIKKQSKRLIELLLPAQCLVCALNSNDKLICHYCERKILTKRRYCKHCALPLNKSADFCGDCLTKDYRFDHIHALGDYTKPLSSLIKQLKYQQQLIAGELLASLLLASILKRYDKTQLADLDFLLSVPLHPKKLQLRGFNQSQIICNYLHKKTGIPMLTQQIKRAKETVAQEGLSIKKRKANLHKAFIYDENDPELLKGKNIAIIDDVVTTAATINSLCNLLKKKGVNHITIFCISRTSLPK